MPYIPETMMNWMIRKLGSHVLEKILKLARNIEGTEWEGAMVKEENRDF